MDDKTIETDILGFEVVPLPMRDAFEVNHMYDRIYQSEKPRRGYYVRESGVDILVLSASEYQPDAKDFVGVEVIHVPYDDNRYRPIHEKDWRMVKATAKKLAESWLAGKTILISCYGGYNRSGLITALTLRHIEGWRGSVAKTWVQMKRQGALHNDVFCTLLDGLPACTPLRER